MHFCTIRVYLEPFGCLPKLGAKYAELEQKFVPRSRIESFRDEHTGPRPLDPKLLFWRGRLVGLQNSVRNEAN